MWRSKHVVKCLPLWKVLQNYTNAASAASFRQHYLWLENDLITIHSNYTTFAWKWCAPLESVSSAVRRREIISRLREKCFISHLGKDFRSTPLVGSGS